jgi:peptide deformylase
VALLEIVTYPDPILLREAQTVPRITRRVRRLARDMLEKTYAASGVELATPQVRHPAKGDPRGCGRESHRTGEP